ncbi:hypothetical protein B0H13DRAFT_1855906 [Mycena leptocephala]|nr:hypothetical protein B0H13DRAFT_1855906 [Mycena leptocephala]
MSLYMAFDIRSELKVPKCRKIARLKTDIIRKWPQQLHYNKWREVVEGHRVNNEDGKPKFRGRGIGGGIATTQPEKTTSSKPVGQQITLNWVHSQMGELQAAYCLDIPGKSNQSCQQQKSRYAIAVAKGIWSSKIGTSAFEKGMRVMELENRPCLQRTFTDTKDTKVQRNLDQLSMAAWRDNVGLEGFSELALDGTGS